MEWSTLPHLLKLVRSKFILKDYMSKIHKILLLAYVFFLVFERIECLENSCISALGHYIHVCLVCKSLSWDQT